MTQDGSRAGPWAAAGQSAALQVPVARELLERAEAREPGGLLAGGH